MSKANRKPTGEKKSAKKTGETTPSKKRAKKGAQASAAQHEEGTPTHELPGEAPVRQLGAGTVIDAEVIEGDDGEAV